MEGKEEEQEEAKGRGGGAAEERRCGGRNGARGVEGERKWSRGPGWRRNRRRRRSEEDEVGEVERERVMCDQRLLLFPPMLCD